jgi:hypothetical protein
MSKCKVIVPVIIFLAGGFGFFAYQGAQEEKVEECQRLNRMLDCNRAWWEHRLHPTLGNTPLCDQGELSLHQETVVINKILELGPGCDINTPEADKKRRNE